MTNPRVGIVIDLLENKIGDNFISSKIEDVFNPVFISADVGSPEFDGIMENEERKAGETTSLMKTVSSIVDRLSREFERVSDGGAEQKQKSIIKGILSKIKIGKKRTDSNLTQKEIIEDVNAALTSIEDEGK